MSFSLNKSCVLGYNLELDFFFPLSNDVWKTSAEIHCCSVHQFEFLGQSVVEWQAQVSREQQIWFAFNKHHTTFNKLRRKLAAGGCWWKPNSIAGHYFMVDLDENDRVRYYYFLLHLLVSQFLASTFRHRLKVYVKGTLWSFDH